MGGVIAAHPLLRGSGRGPVLATTEPLSFWGGVDPQSGRVIDQRHELVGQSLSGNVLLLPGSRGSSSSSGILLELIRTDLAPAAIILSRVDPILALGAIVGRELYDKEMPILVVNEPDFATLSAARQISVAQDGRISWA